MEPWTIKHQPEKISEIKGQDNAVKEIEEFLKNYDKQKKKALLLHGPTGVGKTAAVVAFAKEHDYEFLEVNASDFRNKDKINSIIGENSKQMSLFMRPKLILVDEIDGLSGQKDRGGAPELARQIKTTNFPIIMTANDAWNKKLSPVRKESKVVEFSDVDNERIIEVLSWLCGKENVEYDELVLKAVARKNAGDVRGAVNDLQSLAREGGKITKEKVNELSDRRKTEELSSALIKIFKTTDADIAKDALNDVNEDLDECMLWVDENLPKEYEKPEDLARAYDNLSKADVYKGRIRRWQHWRFLVYYNALMTAGVATAKDEKYKKMIKYEQTKRLLKMWFAKQSNSKRNAIAEKLSEKTHKSIKQTIKETIPYMKVIFKNNKEMSDKLVEELELEKEEVAWLKK